MAKESSPGLLAGLQRWARQLKSPQLLTLVGMLFLLDLAVPDPIPFLDEAILGILTILLARWKRRDREPAVTEKPPPKDVTPPAG